MNIINGEPVKAFMYQDHEAHIQAHMSLSENPEVMQIMEKAPNAQAAMAAMSSHVQEHVAFAYRAKIEKELGVNLPGPDEPLPEDIELRLSRLVAPAAQQLTGKAQAMAQAEKAAAEQEDPIVQMRQQELQIKQQQAQAKAQSDMAKIQSDLETANKKLMLEAEKVQSTERIEAGRISAKMASDNERNETQKEIEGFKAGFNLVRDALDNE
jgi:hypothetical protein